MRPLLAMLFLAYCPFAAAQSPDEIVQAFFGPSGVVDKDASYTGEMLRFKEQPTLGETLPKGVSITTRPLLSTDTNVVIGVTLAIPEHAQDWYAYFRKSEGRWRLEAVRTLALTGIPSMVLAQLEEKQNRSSEEEWTLQNLRLLFKSDAELMVLLKSHSERLGKIITLIPDDHAAAVQATRDLHFASVEKTSSGLIEFVIGGLVDNSVGILWVPPGMVPPHMSPDSYILVEHVVGSWYLFKTT